MEAVVQVAHVLEDCFVAAREGRTGITSDRVDVLLRGVDMLEQLTRTDAGEQAAGSDPAAWQEIAGRIAEIASGREQAGRTSELETFRAPATMDAAWSERQREILAALLRSHGKEIRFDLDGCERIAPAGLALLALVAKRAGTQPGTRLTIAHASGPLSRLLHVTGLDRSYRLVETRA